MRENRRRKRLLSLALTVTMIAGIIATAPGTSLQAEAAEDNQQKKFYVATDGADTNDGSKEAPFATIERARQEVAKINDDMTGNIVVNIAPGDYYLTETLAFGVEDSGTNGYEIIYRSTGEPGSARLIGGQRITGAWTLADETDVAVDLDSSLVGKVYKTQLEAGEYDFNTLYVNDQRAVLARTKNKEYDERFPSYNGEYMVATGGIGKRGLYYQEGDLSEQDIAGLEHAYERGDLNAQLFVWSWDVRDWFTDTCYIDRIDRNANAIYLKQKEGDDVWNTTKYGLGGGARFFLQGNLAFLDVPGEYYYNEKTGILYYYPLEGENIENSTVVVPMLDEIITLKGEEKADLAEEPVAEKQVHNITFDGLSIEMTDHPGYYSAAWDYSAWGFPEASEGATNPTFCAQTERVEYQYGAVTMTNTNHITIENTRFANLGYMGVDMYLDNDSNVIENCEFANLGYGAIMMDGGYPGVGKYNNNHTVQNVLIHDIGQLIGHASGISVLSSGYNLFSHLEIYNSPRRAVFISSWQRQHAADSEYDDYRDIYVKYNKFEYIYAHNLEQDSGDDGAFFTFCLFTDANRTYPNYFENIVVDKVGAHPSMKDFTPNGMNLDCSALGVELKNMKIINPQHYNFRYDDNLKVENINKAYYGGAANYQSFDDSQMPYDEIGLTEEFPKAFTQPGTAVKEYENVYYREEFDNGLNDWQKTAGNPTVSDVYFSDSEDYVGHSFLADAYYQSSSEGCRIAKPFGTNLNQVVEIDFFDHVSPSKNNGYCSQGFEWKLNSFARVDNGRQQIAIGVDSNVDNEHFSYKIGSITKVTDVERSYGWHTLKWDYTSGEDVKLYIDDTLIGTAPAQYFNYIEMGDWGQGGFNAYDNVVIYGDAAAEPPVDLPPEIQEPDAEEANFAPGCVEAEKAKGENLTVADCPDGGKMLKGLKEGNTFRLEVYSPGDYRYTMDVRYASEQGAKLSMSVNDGEALTAELPAGGIDVWTTEKEFFGTVDLKAGKNILTFRVESGALDLNYLDIAKYRGVYGRVEAESGDFSEGASQPSLENADGGTVLGLVAPGQIYKYTFSAPADGEYTIMYRAAVWYQGQQVECWVNGEQQSVIDLPGISSWDIYQDINGGKVQLKEGENEIVLKTGGAGPWVWNFNWFEIVDYVEYSSSDVSELEALLMEAESLLSRYAPCEAYYELKAVVLEAQDIYGNPQSQSEVDREEEMLQEAMEKFLQYVQDNSEKSPEDVLNEITVRQPDVTDTMLVFENVPDFYSVSVDSCEPAGYIGRNKALIMPDEDMEATLTLTMTRQADGAESQGQKTVKLPGLTVETVAASLKVENPDKNADKIILPKVPNGFKVVVKESTNDIIGEDGSIRQPMQDTEVELVLEVSKPLTGAATDISMTISIRGVGKAYGVAIQADEIDELHGTYVKVQNNEVMNFNPGDWLRYGNVDFGEVERISSVYIETAVHPDWAGKTLEIILDDLSNEPVGSIVVEAFGDDWGIYGIQEAVLNTPVSGYHTMYLRAVAGGNVPNEGAAGIKTVKVDRPSSVQDVVIGTMENGTVQADKTDAMPGETVTLTVMPDTGWTVTEGSLKVNDGSVEVTGNGEGIYTFTMPETEATVTAEFEKIPTDPEEPEEVKKELLRKTYDYALTLDTEGATDAAKELFEKAMAQAKAVLDNPDATQEQINGAWDDLLEGIWGLGVVKGDMTYLKMLIDKAESMIPNEDKYVADNWQKLVDELAEAKEVYNDGNAIQVDIDPAAEELLNAILAQRYKANKSNLEELTRKAEAMDLSGYTQESVIVLKNALAVARAVLTDESLSVDDQNQVDQAAKELNDAINNLVKQQTDTGSQTDTGKEDGSTGNATAKTGDNTPIVIWIAAALLALCAGVTAILKLRVKRQG